MGPVVLPEEQKVRPGSGAEGAAFVEGVEQEPSVIPGWRLEAVVSTVETCDCSSDGDAAVEQADTSIPATTNAAPTPKQRRRRRSLPIGASSAIPYSKAMSSLSANP